MQITFSYVDSENVQADFSRTCYPCLTTLMNAGFTVKVAYDTVRSLGIAEVGPVIDLLHELEAQRADGCVRTPLGRRLRRVPQRTYQGRSKAKGGKNAMRGSGVGAAFSGRISRKMAHLWTLGV